MTHMYGTFTDNQIAQIKTKIRKSIFFILLCCDPKTSEKHKNINVENAFLNLLYWIGGMNSLLYYPDEIVKILSLLQRAYEEYMSTNYSFRVCRKLLLDAGSEVLNIKEEDD